MSALPVLVIAAGCAVGAPQGGAERCTRGPGFELSLVSDTGGQASPVAAATWFASHGGVDGMPSEGWQITGRSYGEATLAAARSRVHAVRGPDGTWQVDSGGTCR